MKHMMNKKTSHKWVFVCLLFALLFTIVITMMIGSMGPVGGGNDGISFQAFWDVISGRDSSSAFRSIILDIRLSRIFLAGLVGISLAVAGTTMQGVFKNPMADPYIIGISSGASVGAAVSIFLDIKFDFSLPILAFLGALLAVFLVYDISRVGGKVKVETLLLSGIAMGAFLSAITSFLICMTGKQLHFLVFWLMGGLYLASWKVVATAFPPILLGTVGIFFFSRHLNVLTLGDEPALNLGIDIDRTRKILLTLTALVAGVAVAFSGIIGFVGLIMPHIMRLLVGPNHRTLLPASALAGAIFLIWADTLARTIIAPTELPVGIITALCGAPFFIYLLRKHKGGVM
jgi:ABC-type Fe3+-siderophore transport system, permease component